MKLLLGLLGVLLLAGCASQPSAPQRSQGFDPVFSTNSACVPGPTVVP